MRTQLPPGWRDLQRPAKSPLGRAEYVISKASLPSLVLPPELFDKTEWSMPPVPWG